MFALLHDLQGSLGTRLLSVLLHSLWQGGALALLAGLLLRRIPASRPSLRYGVVLGSLLTTVLACFLTWSFLGPAWSFSAAAAEADNAHAAASTMDRSGGAAHGSASHDEGFHESSHGSSHSSRSSTASTSGSVWSMVRAVAIPLLLGVWFAGVLVMLARTATSLHAARQLLRGTPVADPSFLELVDRVRRRVGVARPVRVLTAPRLATPVICGLLWPALVIPESFLTGVTLAQQLAIVAHELAHICRWDFLVNLLQLVIESVLFFNPAIWWLSRQVRIEREACCDAIAVSLTDAPLEYAQTLATWAERLSAASRGPVLAPAFAEPADGRGGGENSLVDRVRRVLLPAHTPHIRVRWGTFFTLLAIVGATLLLVARGTDWAVAQAAKALTDAERIQVVAQARQEVKSDSPADLKNGKPVTVLAQLRTWDGKPVRVYYANLHSQAPGSGYSLGTNVGPDGAVNSEIQGGQLAASFVALGYAPVIFPPRPAMGGTEVDYGEVVLPAGRTARVRFVDPAGKPVAAEQISGAPTKVSCRPSVDLRANADGEFTFENVIEETYQVAARARGFQPIYQWQGTLPERDVTTIVMKPARPVTGMVIDEDGRPVPGVEICATNEQVTLSTPNGSHGYGNSFGFPGQHWETTDAEGHFRIDQIADGASVEFALKKDGVPRALITDVAAGQIDVVWKLDPAITIRGRVTGDLDLINKDARYRSIFFSILRRTRKQENDQVQTDNIKVEPDGRFEVTGLVRGKLSIHTQYVKFERQLTGPIDDLEIPLGVPSTASGPATRSLKLLFTHRGKAVVPGGRIAVHAYQLDQNRRPFPVESPETTVEVPATGHFQLGGSELLGFAMEKANDNFQVAELGPTLVVPVVPAGVIRGTILDADGKPATGAKATVRISVTSEKHATSYSLDDVPVNATGEFLLNPVPLGGTANVTAALDRLRTMAEPIQVDASHPEATVTLRLPRMTSASVRVFDDAGQPLAECPIGLELTTRNAATSTSHGFGSVAVTDNAGNAQITGLGEPLDAYTLFSPRTGPWLAQKYQLRPGRVTEIHLVKGLVLEGTVLDDAGKPVLNVTVAASLRTEDFDLSQLNYFEAEQKTGPDGKFRFSNLPDKPVQLTAHGVTVSNAQTNSLYSPGGPPVTIQGTPAAWLRQSGD